MRIGKRKRERRGERRMYLLSQQSRKILGLREARQRPDQHHAID